MSPPPLPADWMIVFYLGVTGLLIAIFHKNLPRWYFHLVARAACIGGILWLSFSSNSFSWPPLFQVLRDWYPIVTILIFYRELTFLTQLIFQEYLDDKVLQWEGRLFRGQPSIYLSNSFPYPALSEFLHFCYVSYYGIVVFLVAVLYLQGRREAFQEVVFVEVFTSNLCFLWHLFMPVTGPRYQFEKIKGPLARGFFYKLTHLVLSRGSSKGTAFPSSHVAVTLVILLSAPYYDLISFILLGPIGVGLIFGTVYGRFHYAVDALAGAALACIIFLIAPTVYRWLL